MSSTTDARAAACALLMRTAAKTLEVYLVLRARSLAFLGGFHVFPGGTLEEGDGPMAPEGSDPRMVAALRELFEETGVLALGGAAAVSTEARRAARRAVIDDPAAWPAFVAEHGLEIEAEALVPFGAWVTPPYVPVVFAARYFGVHLPDGETPEVWDGELTHGAWYTPADAIRGHEMGELFISYPTLETLKALVKYDGDLDAAAADLEARGEAAYALAGGEMITGLNMAPVKTFTLPPATHTNCYILGREELVVVDPATPVEEEQERLIAYLRHLMEPGATLREIWLTHHHKDHIGAVNLLRDTFGIPVAAHRLTAEALAGDIEIDRFIEDGDVTELPNGDAPPARWEALHTPGHARGHLCFYEQRLGSIISGDNVLGLGTVLIAPPDGNMVDYMASLRRMKDRKLGFLFPAHGPSIATAGEKIQFYIDHRTAREESIYESLESEMTAAEIVPLVYTDVDPMVFPLAEINVRAHLEKLVAEERVVETGDRFRRAS